MNTSEFVSASCFKSGQGMSYFRGALCGISATTLAFVALKDPPVLTCLP